MKTLRVAMMALSTVAVLLVLIVTPITRAFASTTAIQVASEAPITAGSSRSECLTANFTNTGLTSLQAAITSFDTLTNSTVTCVSAYLNGEPTWSDWESPWVTSSMYGYTSWVAEAPQTRQLVLAMDLIPTSLEDISDPLSWEQSCAAGDFDSYATELGTNLVAAGLQNSVLRLGVEMNGTWEIDFIGTTTQEQNTWASCFANEVTALRAVPGENFLIDWDTNACKGAYPYANYYPGNAYVDIVGLDLYDVDCTTPNTSVSFSQLSAETYGLSDFEAFAAAQGKPMSLPEWGLSTVPSGDDPAYIDGMASTVANNNFAFETYFDGAGGTNSKALALSSSTPLSLAAYQDWFGPPTSISGVVTAASGGDLSGICAEAYVNGVGLATSAPSAANGTYTITGLPPGSYDVEFFTGSCGSGNYATQWYNNTPTGASTVTGAVAVAPTVVSPATGINAAMALGATISGTVTAAVGATDVAGVCVTVTSTSGGSGGSATTASNGTYSVSRLATGLYDVIDDPTCGGTTSTTYASPQPTTGAVAVTAGGSSTRNFALVLPGSIVDVITPNTIAPTSAVVGGATYSPSATATSGDAVQITLDGTSTGCAMSAGVVSFTVTGTCIIDFNDPSSGPSDAYASAAQVQQTFGVAASSGGGGGGGGGGGAPPSTPSPPVTVIVSPPTTPPPPVESVPTPREVTYTTDSVALSLTAKDVLRALAKKLTAGGSITVVGYAHDNALLARRRAAAVANFFVHLVSVHVSIKVVTTSIVDKVMVITTKA